MPALRLLRRLIPPVQVAACSGCGRALRERRRRPCPSCGDGRRLVNASITDRLVFHDRA
ncbi:MAG: hypothetical protein L0227_14700 [Chloroflexi bacterium]|nr:hypothetical protein [Chloroflexota bacterium]